MSDRKRIKTYKSPPKKVASTRNVEVEHRVIDHTILSQSVGIIKERRLARVEALIVELADVCKITFNGDEDDQ